MWNLQGQWAKSYTKSLIVTVRISNLAAQRMNAKKVGKTNEWIFIARQYCWTQNKHERKKKKVLMTISTFIERSSCIDEGCCEQINKFFCFSKNRWHEISEEKVQIRRSKKESRRTMFQRKRSWLVHIWACHLLLGQIFYWFRHQTMIYFYEKASVF